MQKKILKLADVRNELAGECETADGKVHPVKQLTFDQQQRLESAADLDSIRVLRAEVAIVVPTLTEKDLDELTPMTARALLTLAGAGIEAVEAQFPNAVGPATSG